MNRQNIVVALAAVAGAALAAVSWHGGGAHLGLLSLVGLFAGLSLYHSSFGFTSAWRRMIVGRRTAGVRAQIAMLTLTVLVFFPLLAQSSALDPPLSGFVNPVGLALCVGAFLFGVGMQLGGGCASGTLYATGGGNSRTLVTLAAFILGSLLATANPLGWLAWPSFGAYSIVDSVGVAWALLIALGAFGTLYAVLLRMEASAHDDPHSILPRSWPDIWRGPWPVLVGAAALALVNIATLILVGRPWGITSAFALWGAKGALLLGIDAGSWTYWRNDASLTQSVFSDATSVMDVAIVIGAFGGAGLARQFRPQSKAPLAQIAASTAGGLLMGFGARLATGCNIGAFFSGVASGSLHGIIWLLCAIPGNVLGIRLRPYFRLPV